MRRLALILLTTMLLAVNASAQDNFNLQVETRIDYKSDYLNGHHTPAASGFKGQYLNVIMTGNIGEHFSYGYRQRLNKAHADQSFFDATDWLYLTYSPTENWQFAAGKQVVGIGGYEYDRAPIDLYFCSEFWNNIACYQLGASVTYTTKSQNDKLMFQACQSPFRANADDMYAYNFMWMGSHKWYQSLWSVNIMEHQPSEYIYYVALGNQFTFDNFRLQADVMGRTANKFSTLMKDFSLMGEASYTIADKVNIFARATYDYHNALSNSMDYCVLPDTELTRIGAGVEFFPLKGNRNIRLHAIYNHTLGHNGNTSGVLQPDNSMFFIGLKWKVDVISSIKKVFNINSAQ